jgi:hypothetical protein
MKKILGILGVAVIAATMFFSTNNVNEFISDVSLISINTANAQENPESSSAQYNPKTEDCPYEDEYGTKHKDGTETCCLGGNTTPCTVKACAAKPPIT